MCKTPVKSPPPTNQHPVFLQAGCPSCHPTNSVKALKGKYHIPWTCSYGSIHTSMGDVCIQTVFGWLTWGLSTLSLTTNSSWLPWGRVAMSLISPLTPKFSFDLKRLIIAPGYLEGGLPCLSPASDVSTQHWDYDNQLIRLMQATHQQEMSADEKCF